VSEIIGSVAEQVPLCEKSQPGLELIEAIVSTPSHAAHAHVDPCGLVRIGP
jgi:hypothetical protein